MNIIPVIRDLLMRNRKAVIPGFGSFILAHKPAQLNKITQVLTPPSVTVRFDRRKQDDDGQLTGYLSRKLKLSTEKSRKLVENFRLETEGKLEQQGSVVLEGLGTLSGNVADTVFVPEEELLKRISLFEMPEVDIPRPVQEKTPQKPVQEKTPSRPVQEKTPPKPVEVAVPVQGPGDLPLVVGSAGRKRWILPVVLLGLLLGMLLVIYLTGNMEMLVSDIKSAIAGTEESKKETPEQLVFGKTGEEQQPDTGTTEQINRELESQVSREKALSFKDPDPESPVQSPGQTKPQTLKPVVNQDPGHTYAKPYHIIAGSFTVLGNAEKQRSALQAKGLKAEILPRKGNFYMVSLGSYDNPEQASAAMKQIQVNLQNELWVMRNR